MTPLLAFAASEAVLSPQIQAIIEQQVRRRTREFERREKELQERNAYLLNLHNEKNDWLQMLVHDLKNPLSSIMLAGSFLEKYWKRMTLTEFTRNTNAIQTNANRMNILISRVLSLGALESGVLDLAFDHINTPNLLALSVQEYTNQSVAKGITCRLNMDTDEAFVFVDRCAFLEVIDNLLSNSVKYSPRNTTITINLASDRRNQILRIEFQDQGAGIKPEEFDKLFTKFAQLSSRPTGGEHSTGLGLAIVKKLVTSMRGKVWCESQYGQGSTFIVEFPLSHPKQYLEVVENNSVAKAQSATSQNTLPLAIEGFDAVGYFLAQKPMLGKAEISSEWDGKIWRFHNEYHKELFLENPERFAPKYRGYCAFGMSRNLLGNGNPQNWSIVDDELFFSYNEEVLQEWLQKKAEYIAEANEHWKHHAEKFNAE